MTIFDVSLIGIIILQLVLSLSMIEPGLKKAAILRRLAISLSVMLISVAIIVDLGIVFHWESSILKIHSSQEPTETISPDPTDSPGPTEIPDATETPRATALPSPSPRPTPTPSLPPTPLVTLPPPVTSAPATQAPLGNGTVYVICYEQNPNDITDYSKVINGISLRVYNDSHQLIYENPSYDSGHEFELCQGTYYLMGIDEFYVQEGLPVALHLPQTPPPEATPAPTPEPGIRFIIYRPNPDNAGDYTNVINGFPLIIYDESGTVVYENPSFDSKTFIPLPLGDYHFAINGHAYDKEDFTFSVKNSTSAYVVSYIWQ